MLFKAFMVMDSNDGDNINLPIATIWSGLTKSVIIFCPYFYNIRLNIEHRCYSKHSLWSCWGALAILTMMTIIC